MALYADDTIGDRKVGQTDAFTERTVPNTGDAVADHEICQARTVRKSTMPNAGETVAYRRAIADHNADKVGAVMECIVLDAGNAVANLDRCQAVALKKRSIPYGGDAIGYRDVCQTVA